MPNDDSRILTTHVGSLVRPQEIIDLMRAKEFAHEYDREELAGRVRSGVAEVVQRQLAEGVDIPSDGEYGKSGFSAYVNERLAGYVPRPKDPKQGVLLNWGRDRTIFRDFYLEYDQTAETASGGPVVCEGPISYIGQSNVQADIDNFKAALSGTGHTEAFIPAVAPGTIELQRKNEYYPTDEAYLFAIADAMHEEYKAITDAGFILQLDDPRVVTQYGMPDPAPTIEEYRRFAALRVEAINHALKGIPRTVCTTICVGVAGTAPMSPTCPSGTSWISSWASTRALIASRRPIPATSTSGRCGRTSNCPTARNSSPVWWPIPPTWWNIRS